jgi:hypothetical protein
VAVQKKQQKPRVAAHRSIGGWLLSTFKSQWLAATLLFPLAFFVMQTYVAREDAKEARRASISVDRISKFQDSGKALDVALASYFQSIAELGLAEQKLEIPGRYKNITLAAAQSHVVEARIESRKALAIHASDVQSLRGVFKPDMSKQYLHALVNVEDVVDNGGDIKSTGKNITRLAALVKTRNEMVDGALGKLS